MDRTSQLKRFRITSGKNPTRFFGIDGARKGWVLAGFEGGALQYSFATTILELFNEAILPYVSKGQVVVFIDMPIGLPERGERACDVIGRKLLGGRRSTLFPVPVRSSVYANSFEEAGALNLVGQGKKVSLQFWNIAPKVRELDRFLREDKSEGCGNWFESHPELAFGSIAGKVLEFSKHTKQGIEQRYNLITSQLSTGQSGRMREFIASARARFSKVDVLDATILALLPRHASELVMLSDGARDVCNLPQRIVIDSDLFFDCADSDALPRHR